MKTTEKPAIYPVFSNDAKQSYLTETDYHTLYKRSLKDPQGFWAEQAERFVSWNKTWEHVLTGSLKQHDARWFVGAKLNASYNCLDRHLRERGDQVAIIWEGDDPKQSIKLTYRELHEKVCQFANVLKSHGIKKGDRVCIYLPMIPEAAIAMLACARIGAIHSVVFGGFSAESLKTRLIDAACRLLITADESVRGGKVTPLKKNADIALADAPTVETVLVVKRSGNSIPWRALRDHWYDEAMLAADKHCDIESMEANDPLFILYTSGSTGKPKGVLHSTGGYLVYACITHHYVFDYHPGDIYWCTADVGWITGHTYLLYGPLANGATTLMFEGVPNYPSHSRYWEIIDKHQVNIFYTAPTAIRALRREGDEWVKKTSRLSLRLLGTVGEPINPEVWEWYYEVVGDKRCPVVDTWWQTETGGIVIAPFPGATPLKPGSAAWPFFGIETDIVGEDGKRVKPDTIGKLVINTPWPGFMLTIYNDPKRFIDTYFADVPGHYLTGDSARRDDDGYLWIIGRDDDVIKVSGHRIGTGELENAFLTHPAVAEAAVIGVSHEIKGQGIYAYITLKGGQSPSASLEKELTQVVRERIGAIATPEKIQWADGLPKTRSGKIMRRILRKIADKQFDELGDTSTLSDPSVVDDLIKRRKAMATD